jgi:four helix bundle suffix protein
MVQAARSGRQNIAEGSRAAATSSKTELRLLNEAHSSFEELLLDQQIAALERRFVEEGVYSEQLAAARVAERQRRRADQSDQSDRTDQIPNCPQCGKAMVLRTAKTGRTAGEKFWGCSGYPECKGTAPV